MERKPLRRYKLQPTIGKEDQPAIRRYRLTRLEEVADGDTVKPDERRAMRFLPAPIPRQEHSRQHL
jgi:hypothetical protein